VIKVKEVKVRPQIGDHDLKWRADQAKDWLNDNAQVKFKIQAYGRIGYKPELIQETYDKFLGLLGETAKVLTPLKKLTPVLYEATIVKNK
jgi:translation initiation factor IF-3